ncbi:MAG TPA: 4Fe-4S binding protein [Anaerolineales bacterium]|nr:4Fe-4S binding protein [Anaerolineales bacterium]
MLIGLVTLIVEIERCRDCAVCMEACPFRAIELLGSFQKK